MTQKANYEFAYESDASSSFLVIQGDMGVIEYQVSMLANNRIAYVIPVDVVKKEGVVRLYYNITSKISLSLFLSIKELGRDDFLKLLLNIATAVDDSSGYLLTFSNYIFNPDYIYLDPETLEPFLIYLPSVQTAKEGVKFTDLISRLVMKHINIAGFENSNAVQRILASVKSETFSIKSLIALLTELLYGQDASYFPQTQEDSEPIAEKAEESGEEKIKSSSAVTAIAVLAQIVIGAAIYMSRDFLKNVGENTTTTYAAVAVIVLALEVLIFKKLNDVRLINFAKASEGSIMLKRPQMVQEDGVEKRATVSAEEKVTSKGRIIEQSMDDRGDTPMTPICSAAKTSGKTELLAPRIKGVRTLKSDGRQGADKDILIDKDDFIIGRLEGYVDCVLKNNAVGKLHAQLVYRNGTCYIKDLNSVNGTFINNRRIESNKEYEIKENDRLYLANSEFIYQC